MHEVVVETTQGTQVFTADTLDDALEFASKLGGLIFDVTITVLEGKKIVAKEEWYNGMVKQIPVNTPKPDLSVCGVCNDNATTNNGLIGLCDDCNDLMLHMIS